MNNIPITMPYIGQEELDAVQDVLKSGWLVQGKKVEQFEKQITEHENVRYGCATTSCTTALQLAMLVMGMGSGMDVIVPSFTFVATANAVVSTGAVPVLFDVDIDTYNLDVQSLERYIRDNYSFHNEKLKNRRNGNALWGIVPVHQFGLCADMAEISHIASQYGLKVLEDGACALGSMIKELHIGEFGNPVCVSFHPRKSITTGEGGMILTNDAELCQNAKTLRNHGSSVSSDKRHDKNGTLLPQYIYSGYNYRMTDIQGAIGCEQIKKLDFILEKRRKAAQYYDQLINGICKNIITPYVPEGYYHTYQSYVCRLKYRGDLKEGGKKRNYIMNELSKVGIATRQGTHAVHKLDYYKNAFGLAEEALPNANQCDLLTISLPLYTTITEKDQECVVEHLKKLSEE